MTTEMANMMAIDRTLAERVPEVIEAWIALLRYTQRRQIAVDPEWTTVEIAPEQFERLLTAMERAATDLRGYVTGQPANREDANA